MKQASLTRFIFTIAFIFTCTIYAQAPVGYWKFDEGSGTTAIDSSSNGNNGSLIGMATSPWNDGKLFYALSFNETSDYVQISDDSSLKIIDDLSISMWIKPTSVGVSTCTLIDKSYGGEFMLRLQSDGGVRLFQGRGTSSGQYYGPMLLPAGSIVNDEWQHLLVTRDMTSNKLAAYINGEYRYSIDYPNDSSYYPPLATSNSVKIGSSYSGDIDAVRVYNRVLSRQEILLQSHEKNYLAHLLFNEGSGTTTSDSTYHENDASLVNMGSTPWGSGIGSMCLDFEPSNGYLSINNSSSLQVVGDLSISLLIKPSSLTTCTLVDKSYGGEFMLRLQSDGGVRLFQGRGTSSGQYYGPILLPAGTIVSNEWQHLVVIRDMAENKLKAYVDGEFKYSTDYPDNSNYYPPLATTNDITIGTGYSGLIDNVIIVDRIFSSDEVEELYSSNALRGSWDMNEGSETNVSDLSEYQNHASFVNMSSDPWVSGHLNMDGNYKTALSFDESGDYLSISNDKSLQIAGDLTISMWINPLNIGISTCSLIDKSYGGEFMLRLQSDGGVRLFQGRGTSSGQYYGPMLLPAGSIINDEWQHLVVTRDMTTNKLTAYINGELKNFTDYPDNSNYYPPLATTNDITVGVSYSGDIDKLRIYSRILSEEEIMQEHLLSAWASKSYYTTENAVAVCELDISSDAGLINSTMVVKNSSGTTLATTNSPKKTTELAFNTSSLSTGDNTVTVELSRNTGERVFKYDLNIIKRSASPGFETKIDLKNKIIERDGSPFFPIGLYMYGVSSSDISDFQEAADAGFNSVIRWTYYEDTSDSTTYLENANDYGLLVVDRLEAYTTVVMRHYAAGSDQDFWDAYKGLGDAPINIDQSARIISSVGYAKQEDNLLCYYSFDEPYLSQTAAGEDLYGRINNADGYHPVITVIGYEVPETSPDSFTTWNDIIGADPYWIPPKINGDLRSSVDWFTQAVCVMKQWSDEQRKPLWVIPMSEYHNGSRKRAILPKEQRCQTYVAVINGAKGIFYFRYPIYHDSSWSTLSELTGELEDIAPSVLTPEIEQTINYSDSSGSLNFNPINEEFVDVQVRLFKALDGESYDYLLLAVNCQSYPVDVDINVSLLGSTGTIFRLFSTTTYSVLNGEFSDQIEGFGTRAYTFSSSSSSAINIDVDMTARTDLEPTAETAPYPRTGRPGMTNMMQNPSLEDATIANWPDYCFPYYASPRINAQNQGWGLETTSPYHGSKCLKIIKNQTNVNGLQFNLVPAHDDNNGKDYTFSVYMKASQSGLRVKLGNTEANNSQYTLTTSWARYEYTCNLPKDLDLDEIYSKFYLYLIDDGTIWIDAIQVEVGSSATTFTTN
jgi:Concanavalin A-like lectin/glucanases superfamily